MYDMKRILALCALAIALMAAASCQKAESDGTHSEPYYPCNDADILLNKVLAIDNNQTITGTRGGFQLDEADPGKVTILAETYEEAKQWFDAIVPDYAELISNSDRLIWNLRDTLSASQGQAILKPASGKADGRIAEVEVPVSARPLSSIVFIPRSALPLNDDEIIDRETCDALDYFYLGALVTVDDGRLPEGAVAYSGFIRGRGAFVVIQEYTVGVRYGYLLHLEPGEQNIMSPSVDDSKHFLRASAVWTLQTVHDILKANPSLLSNFDALKMPSWDNWFLCFRNSVDSNRYRYHLKNGGDIERLWFFGSWYYYEAYVYQFEVRTGNSDYVVSISPAD